MWQRIIFVLIIAWVEGQSKNNGQGFIDLTNSKNRCVNPVGQGGICIPIRQCPSLVNLLVNQRQQAGVTDFLRKSVCGYQGLDPKVCCVGEGELKLEQVSPKSVSTTTVAPKAPNPTTSRNNVDTRLPRGKECGQVAPQHTRVVGGTNATLGAWPWMAALGYKSTKGGTEPIFLCAGSLVTRQHILTAAHCLTNTRSLMLARVGDLNLYEDNDGATPIDAKVARTIIHEDYNPTTFTNDIGLIVLEKPVTFTKLIKPICIPLARELRAKDYVNRKPFIAGWGSVSFSGPSSATLLELQIPVVPESECKRAFEAFKTAVIDKRVLCAGYLRGGKDACKGDSGGPLMDYNNQDKLFYQIGVVSYGFRCAEPGFPGIYTRVTEFVDWIVNKIENSA